jgi:DNA ligase-1
MHQYNEGLAFEYLAELCANLEKTSSRIEKTRLLSSFLKLLRPEEIEPAVAMITGKTFPESDKRVLDVGGKTVWRIIQPARQTALTQSPLTIKKVQKYFEDVASLSGGGSRRRKEALIDAMFGQASPLEREYIARILFGEMRIGVVEGVMEEAIAEAAGVDLELVKRANMLSGNLGAIAKIALEKGVDGLRDVSVKLFTPIKPMLAEMSSLNEVFAEHSEPMAFEYKFDGIRIQAHKEKDRVAIYTRRLTDATASLPDIVKVIRENIHAAKALVEGEVVGVGPSGKPLPFQDLMRRFRRTSDVERTFISIPLRLYLFDILLVDETPLFDLPYQERWKILTEICGEQLLAKRIVTDQLSEAEQFLSEALKAGHEGLMAKSLDGTYLPGMRGKKWLKIKPAESLDLVIIAADWGSGRRNGWLSNYHLAVKDEETDKFLDVGKTFKGLTDAEFRIMTDKLQRLKLRETAYTVFVKPEIVVEVAYNEIQKSPHYNSGFALRFARITRIRDDKSPEETNTIENLQRLYQRQFEQKARFQPPS